MALSSTVFMPSIDASLNYQNGIALEIFCGSAPERSFSTNIFFAAVRVKKNAWHQAFRIDLGLKISCGEISKESCFFCSP